MISFPFLVSAEAQGGVYLVYSILNESILPWVRRPGPCLVQKVLPGRQVLLLSACCTECEIKVFGFNAKALIV